MKKIPLRQQSETEEASSNQEMIGRAYLPDALETLLLGGIWWHVLILLPLLQQAKLVDTWTTFAPVLFKMQGMVTCVVALVVLVFRWAPGGEAATGPNWRALSLLLAIAGIGGAMAWISTGEAPAMDTLVYAAALQGVVALACFLSRRIHSSGQL